MKPKSKCVEIFFPSPCSFPPFPSPSAYLCGTVVDQFVKDLLVFGCPFSSSPVAFLVQCTTRNPTRRSTTVEVLRLDSPRCCVCVCVCMCMFVMCVCKNVCIDLCMCVWNYLRSFVCVCALLIMGGRCTGVGECKWKMS